MSLPFPHRRIGPHLLINGDARLVLPHLEGGADLLVTDPPYKLTSGGNTKSPGHQQMSGKFAATAYANDGAIVDCDIEWDEWLGLAFAALGTNADAYVMCNDKHLLPSEEAALAAGFRKHNTLVWEKPTATPNKFYMKNLEFVHYLWKGKARTVRDPGYKQLLRAPGGKASNHPTEKPVALMEVYIAQSSHNRADVVLDPFMGSGTTGIAAARRGRPFIGIEKNERWFDVSCRRLELEMGAPNTAPQFAMGEDL